MYITEMTKSHLHDKAKILRRNGVSIKQIAHELKVSASTASVWVRGVSITTIGKTKIAQRSIDARIKSGEILQRQKKQRALNDFKVAEKYFQESNLNQSDKFLLTALIYECEGGKSERSSLEFTNSDPVLVGIFLKLLRSIFHLDESKFRVIMHLHSYHNEKNERKFWSKITNIPEKQFLKTYQKAESGKIKSGYRGCVQIKYFDVSIKRTLLAGKILLARKLGL